MFDHLNKNRIVCEQCGRAIKAHNFERHLKRHRDVEAEAAMRNSPERDAIRRAKISKALKAHPNGGGYRHGSGRGVSTKYVSPIAGTIYLDSTYEERFANYLDDQGLIWERNKDRFPYTDNQGNVRKYIPDFIVEGVYVEIKGYDTPLDLLKRKQFPEELIVLYGQDIKHLGY